MTRVGMYVNIYLLQGGVIESRSSGCKTSRSGPKPHMFHCCTRHHRPQPPQQLSCTIKGCVGRAPAYPRKTPNDMATGTGRRFPSDWGSVTPQPIRERLRTTWLQVEACRSHKRQNTSDNTHMAVAKV